jgi:hypothetical protein
MCDTRTYLPCCRDFNGCRQHYPPGIYASVTQGNLNTEYSAEEPKFRSKVTNLLSLAMKSITRRKTPTSKTSILSLPVELLQQIASHLPLASTAAFAFSNKHICHAIGQDSWVELKKAKHKEDKISFLCLIRDSWFCHYCDEFHPRAFDLRPYYRKYDGFDYPFGYRLPSRLVQLAIERIQKGPPHGICPDRLSCAGIFIKPGMRFDYAYRVGVVEPGELILRLDVRIMPPRHDPPKPCMHSPLPPIIMNQKVDLQLGPTRHYKADYPYVPRCPEGVSCPNPQLLKEFSPDAPDIRYTWACDFCTCVTKEAPLLASNYNSHEKLARSHQLLGSGAKDDDKWRRSITPASRLSRLHR